MEEIREALETLVGGQVFEIRALGPTRSRVFAPNDMQPAAEWAAGLSGKVKGVYVTLNPLKPELLASGDSASDGDVLKRRWLPIDVDPVRDSEDKDVSATDAEKARAFERMQTVRQWLTTQGWPEPLVMDSGNGYWLLYAIDLRNDVDAKTLVHGCLKALAAKFGGGGVKIDTTLANASRIGKLPGTLACKGAHTEERPHRLAAFLEVPTDLAPVPREKLEELAGPKPAEEPGPQQQEQPTTEAAAAEAPAGGQAQEQEDYAPLEERIARAKAYVARVDPAVSGQHGHDQTYYVAALLVRDFALPIPDALPIIEEFNKRCKPPWTHQELVRKLHEADKQPGPRGSKAGRRVGIEMNFDPITFEPLTISKDDRYCNAYWHVTGAKYTDPAAPGYGKQEHEKVAYTIVSRYGFGAHSPEAMALLQAYNKTHGQLADLQRFLNDADKRGGIRGRMWPRKYFDHPRRLAMDFVSEHGYWSPKPDDCSTLRFYQDDWYVWDGTKYVKEEKIAGIVNNAIQEDFDHNQVKWRRIEGEPLPTVDLAPLERLDKVLETPGSIYTDTPLMAALAQVKRQDPVRYAGLREKIKDSDENVGPVEAALPKPPQRAKRPKPEHVTPAKVSAVMQHLEALPECRAEEAEDKLISLKNGLLDVEADKLHRHTARRFSTLCLPFDYDPKAECPRWMKFLTELWPSDQQSRDTLQDWFGLVLARDTSLQKMLLVVGPKRAGKGTIAKVLTDLLGLENVTSPTMAEFSENFGLEPFLGKSLGIIPDARLDGRTNIAVIERLLSISGEDRLTINRKYRPILPSVRLRTLLMVLTNETPRFPDKSGALASRFIALQLTETFYGNEETTLEKTLQGELSGIFNWALVGMRRVMLTRKLNQPDSGQQIVQDLHSASSPIHIFAQEIGLEEGPDLRIGIEELFTGKWKPWCAENGHYAGSKGAFGKSLRSVFPRVKDGKLCKGGANCYVGIGIPGGDGGSGGSGLGLAVQNLLTPVPLPS